MPYINVGITEDGVTATQKAQIVSEITGTLQRVLGKPPEHTQVEVGRQGEITPPCGVPRRLAQTRCLRLSPVASTPGDGRNLLLFKRPERVFCANEDHTLGKRGSGVAFFTKLV